MYPANSRLAAPPRCPPAAAVTGRYISRDELPLPLLVPFCRLSICAFCLTTSGGMVTAHDASSVAADASACTSGCSAWPPAVTVREWADFTDSQDGDEDASFIGNGSLRPEQGLHYLDWTGKDSTVPGDNGTSMTLPMP